MKVIIMSEKAFEASQVRTTIENLPYKTYDKEFTSEFIEATTSDVVIEKVDTASKRGASYDLLVLAHSMKKGFSGTKTASVIHSKKTIKPPPIIILGHEYVDKEAIAEGAKMGMGFLRLPYTQHDFQQCLSSIADNMIKMLETNKERAITQYSGKKGTTIDLAEFKSKLNKAIIKELAPIRALAPWNKKPYISLSQHLMEEGDYQTPIPILRAAILISFSGQEPHRLLKVCYQKTGMHKEELIEMKKLLEANPASAELNAKFGEALLRVRDYKNAVEFFKKAIVHHKAGDSARLKAKSHWGVGKSMIEVSDDDETRKLATEEFNRAITVDPTLVLAYFNLISVYKKLGMETQAKDIMKKAVGVSPKTAQDWMDLFYFYLDDGESAKARVSLEKAKSLDPENPLICYNAGDAYLKTRMFRDAADCYEKSVSIYPSDTRVYNSLGICYRQLGKTEHAVEQYLKALEIDPDDYNVHYNLAKAYHTLKDFMKARKAYEKALQLKEDFAEAKESLLELDRDQPKKT